MEPGLGNSMSGFLAERIPMAGCWGGIAPGVPVRLANEEVGLDHIKARFLQKIQIRSRFLFFTPQRVGEGDLLELLPLSTESGMAAGPRRPGNSWQVKGQGWGLGTQGPCALQTAAWATGHPDFPGRRNPSGGPTPGYPPGPTWSGCHFRLSPGLPSRWITQSWGPIFPPASSPLGLIVWLPSVPWF